MQQKPIKRNPQLIKLSRDHHFGLLIVWKIRQGIRYEVAAPRIVAFVLEAFRKELEPHFLQEEKCVFPLLQPDDPMRLRAAAEHQNLRSLQVDLSQDISYDLLQLFANLLDEHIRFEERELFNYIEEICSQELLIEAEKCMQAMPQPVADQWADQFWVKN